MNFGFHYQNIYYKVNTSSLVVPKSKICFDGNVTLGQYERTNFRMFSVFLFSIFIREPFSSAKNCKYAKGQFKIWVKKRQSSLNEDQLASYASNESSFKRIYRLNLFINQCYLSQMQVNGHLGCHWDTLLFCSILIFYHG